jgi:hypothetical protein
MFKFLALLSSLACALLAVAWIVDPMIILDLWGVQAASTDQIVEHRFGAVFACLAVMLYLVRDAQPSPLRRAVSAGIVVGCMVLLIVNAYDLALARIGIGILPGMALQLFCATSFAFVEWRDGQRSEMAS